MGKTIDKKQIGKLSNGVNMVAHRDYRDSLGSTIKIFDNRIEFYNPGKLFGGILVAENAGCSGAISRCPLYLFFADPNQPQKKGCRSHRG